MMNSCQRLSAFNERTKWLSKFMGSRFKASQYLFAAKINPFYLGRGSFGDFPIYFRKGDLQALEEVLVLSEYDFLTEILKSTKQPKILDIGAHIGTFSLWCLNQNKQSKILSLEADPETFEILKKNVVTSEITNWNILNRAAWSANETISFQNSGATMSHKITNLGEIMVTGITLSDFFEKSGFENIDIAKIDVEGAEEAFLFSAPELLPKIKNLVIEIHPQLCNEKKIRDLLEKHYTSIQNVSGRQSSKPLLWCN